jgi:hypothetical protein
MLGGEAAGPGTVVPYIEEEALEPVVARPKPPATYASWVQSGIAAMVFVALVGAGYLTYADYMDVEASNRVLTEHRERVRAEAARQAKKRAEREAAIARREKIVAAIRAEEKEKQEEQEREKERARAAAAAAAAAARARRATEQSAQRPEETMPVEKKQPYCRDVGGYEAYMKRTNQVCRLD